jgi:hypothetical protein
MDFLGCLPDDIANLKTENARKLTTINIFSRAEKVHQEAQARKNQSISQSQWSNIKTQKWRNEIEYIKK